MAGHALVDGDRLSLSLSPAELGRVDIELHLDGDGRTHAHIAVERPETLDLIRQDARQLETSLRDAGIGLAREGLSFGLRDERQPQQQQQRQAQPGSPFAGEPQPAAARPAEPRPAALRLLDLSV
jgi:flagellar hook-length control protein FliK